MENKGEGILEQIKKLSQGINNEEQNNMTLFCGIGMRDQIDISMQLHMINDIEIVKDLYRNSELELRKTKRELEYLKTPFYIKWYYKIKNYFN